MAAIGVFITAENCTVFTREISKSIPVDNMSVVSVFGMLKNAVGTTALAIEAVIVGVTSAGKFTSVFAVAVIGVTI